MEKTINQLYAEYKDMLGDDSIVMQDDIVMLVARIEEHVSGIIGDTPLYESTKNLSLADTQALIATRMQ